ncbi:YDG domain-containing protein [Rhodoferax sp. WC2427]|uniref:YDG domain-containing protein n=1 Tax=Rhodoferax sp. WC2427 TaxID=3234144 RepID=UPI003466F75B
MNHIYQLVWSALHRAWVVVSEVASGLGSRRTTDQRRRPGAAPQPFTLKNIAACAYAMGAGALFLINSQQVSAQTIAPTTVPQGGVVTQGAATLQGAGSASAPVLNINQTSQRAVINWNSFNLGAASTVNFHQPNAQSATLNRVQDMQPSQILGHIHAPGQVTLINPAGVYFSPSAVLDVGALTATTLNQTDVDFMAGQARFQRQGATGSVVNEGTLKATDYIALLAPEVRNQGTITANAVVLAAGESIQLNFDAFSRLSSISVTPSQIAALVENRTAVLAPGGTILLSATALSGLQASVIHSGQLDASSLSARGGRIVLEGDSIALKTGSSLNASGATGGGTVLVGGDWQGSGSLRQATTVAMEQGARIDASATHSGDGGKVVLWSDVHNASSQTSVQGRITAQGVGAGGQVETSGHTVVLDTAQVHAGGQARAGLWLIDPFSYTIGASQAATISSSLSSGTSVTVDTSANVGSLGSSGNSGDVGNVTLDANISKTGGVDTTLTFKAHQSIRIANANDAAITSTSGKLNLVFWADQDNVGAGAVFMGMNLNSVSINTNGGHFWVGGGSGSTTWNGLTVGDGYANSNTLTASWSGVELRSTTINTGGGNLLFKGINDRVSGTDDRVGIYIRDSAISTGTGSLSLDGQSSLRGGSVPVNNGGVIIDGGTLASTHGNIDITGSQNGLGTEAEGVKLINTSVSATGTGNITLLGTADADNGQSATKSAIVLLADSSNQTTRIATNSGNITLTGTVNTTNKADSAGVLLMANNSSATDANWAKVKVVSSSGNITIAGDNPANTNASTLNQAVRFNGSNFGKVYLGQDESGTYTGNLAIQGRQIGVDGFASGYLQARGTGAMAIEPKTSAAGFNRAFTLDSTWDLGSAHSSLALGNANNVQAVTVSAAQTAAGPISIYGGDVALNANLTSTLAGAAMLVKASGNISTAANTSLKTSNGNLTLWSDSDSSGVGSMALGNSNTFNTSLNGASTSQATGGGKITLAGGADSNADGLPDGYAFSATGHGLAIGTTGASNTAVYSGGGDVLFKGKTSVTTTGNRGVQSAGLLTVNSGQGAITMVGESAGSYGMEFSNSVAGTSTGLSLTSAKASGTAIALTGITTAASTHGLVLNNDAVEDVLATGGGGIALTGTGTGSGYGVWLQNSNVLASAGAITVDGGTKGINVVTGAKLGKSTTGVTSSTSNISLTGDVVNLGAATTVDTTGTLTVQPYSASFSSALAYPLSNLTVASTLTGLTLGKTGNAANITVGSNQSINGPINIYGGNVALNASLAATAAGAAVRVLASGDITLAASQSVTTQSGAVLFNADSDGSGAGAIVLNTGSGITSNGGNITLGGGAAGTGAANAIGSSTNISGVDLSGATLSAGGGNIAISGKGYGGSSDNQYGVFVNASSAITTSGTGTTTITGTGGAGTGNNANASSFNIGVSISSSSVTGAAATTITGTGGAASGGQSNKGVFVGNGSTVQSGGTGSLTITGTGGTSIGGNDYGVQLMGTGTTVGSSGGNVGVTGTGGSGPGDFEEGVYVGTAATLSAGGSGTVTVQGTGGSGGGNYGIGVGIFDANTLVTSSGGSVTVSGTGAGSGSGNSHYGVSMAGGATVTSGGTGSVTVQGTSANMATNFNRGTLLDSAATITSAGGNVSVTGQGRGTGTSTDGEGVLVRTGGRISAGGTGSTTVTGTGSGASGSNNQGILVTDSSSAIGSNNGTVTLTGSTGGTTNAGIAILSSGAVQSGGNNAVFLSTDSYTGDATGSISAGTGTVTLQNRTVGTKIDLGGADVLSGSPLTLGLGSAELNRITAGTLVVGRNDATAAGAITVSSAIAPSLATDLTLKTGATIAINAPVTSSTLTLTAAGTVGQTVAGNLTATNLLLNGSGNYALATASSNVVSALAAGGTGTTSYKNNSELQIGTVNGISGISASGPVSIGTASGDLTVAQTVASTDTGSAAVLLNAGVSSNAGTSTGGNIVLSGSPGITTGSGGRATLMTGSVSGSTGLTAFIGSGSGRFRYNSDEATTNYSTGLGSGSYAVYREAPSITVTVNNASKTYDGNAYSGGNGYATSALVNGDSLSGSIVYGGSSQGALNVAGSPYAISASGFSSGQGYAISYTSGSLTVNPYAVSLSGSRSFDGTANVAASIFTLGSLVGGQTLTLGGTGTVASKNVGSGQTVTLGSLALGNGTGLASNYTLAGGTATANITQASLTVATSNVSKTYDTTTSASGTAVVTSGTLFGTDTLSGGSFAFSNKNAGTGNKTVTTSGVTVNDGNGGGNYAVAYANNTTSTITPAGLAVSGVGANNKTYDAGTGATLNGSASIAPLGGDSVTLGGTAVGSFTNKNVGTGKTVTVSGYTLSGTDAANYTVVQPASVTANITQASLVVGGVGAANKVYDTTTTATLTGTAAVAALGSDVVTVGGTGAGSFASKNVGTAKAVTVSGYTLGGADAANYAVVQPTGLAANITQANLAVTGVGAANKVYDATTTASLTGTAAVTALGGDVVTVGGIGAGNFANKNVGTGKAVAISGYTLSGADAANYTVVQPAGVTANITQATLGVTGVAAANKVYDATTTATLSGTAVVTAQAGDVVAVGGGVGSFADKNVGTGKAVTVSGYTLSGADAANYTVVQPTGITANITAANLHVTGVAAANKVYDATTGAALTGTAVVSALGSDAVTLGGTGSGSFADKQVGTGKAVTASGYTLGGTDAANYALVQPTGLAASITPAPLLVTGVGAVSKVYDATTSATLTGTASTTALGTDVVAVGGTGVGNFADKNVGTGKAVAVTGYTLSGADAANYAVMQPTGVAANITQANLVVTGVGAANKVYDTTTGASLTGTATVAALGSDVVAVGGSGTGSFADKNVGIGKTVTVNGFTLGGADAGNYAMVQPTGVTANITPASLNVAGLGANSKVYDTTTTATLTGTAVVAAQGSDVVTVVGTGIGSFVNKSVGTGKVVNVNGYALGGADAANYAVVQPVGVTANITQAPLAVTGVGAANKVYDAATAATLTGAAVVSALGSDVVAVVGAGVGSFADKNVGAGKTVAVSGYSLSGADAANYAVVQPTGVAANITQANLAVTGVGAANTVYDATTAATLAGVAAVTALGSDTVSVLGTGTGSFANKNVGTGKTVSVSGYTLSGTDAANYTVVQPTGVTANITPASVAVTGVGAASKVYDATTNAVLTGSATVAVLGSDVVTVAGAATGSFADRHVGTGKAVAVTGYMLGGADAANYALVQPTGITADITQANLAVTGIAAANKVYDASTAATLTGTAAVAALGSDAVSLGGTGVGSFTDKNAGTGKTVAVSGYTLSGADAANYALLQPVGVTASITPAPLLVTAHADARFVTQADTPGYFGASYSGLVGGETSSVLGGTLAINRPNAVTDVAAGSYAGALVPSGLASSNYTIGYANGLYTILPANQLLVRVANTGSVYGGTPTLAVTSVQYLDSNNSTIYNLAGSGTGNSFSYSDGSNGGIQFTLSPQGAVTSSAGKTAVGNYALTDTNPGVVGANFVGNPVFVGNLAVAQKAVSASLPTVTKTYDGTASLAGVNLGLIGQEAGDSLLVNGTGTFAQKNVGNNQHYAFANIALTGADVGNYYLAGGNSLGGSDGSITPASLTVSTANVVKTYDGTTSAAGSAMVTRGTLFGSDSLSGGSFAFTDKNVGIGNKVVTASGVTLSDGNGGGNYAVAYANNTTSTINPAAITVATANVVKAYDGTTSAAGTALIANGTLFGGDSLSGGSFAFTDPGVGLGSKTVTTVGVVVNDGNGGNNYRVSYANNTTSTIRPVPVTPVTPVTPINPSTPVVPVTPLPALTPSPALTSEVLVPQTRIPVAASPAVRTSRASDSASDSAQTGVEAALPSRAVVSGCIGTSQNAQECGRGDRQNGFVIVTPMRNVSPTLAGQVMVQVSEQVLRSGRFEAALPLQTSVALRARNATTVATRPDGQALPDWLQWDPQSLVLMAKAMPVGALPSTVVVGTGDERVEVEMTALP